LNKIDFSIIQIKFYKLLIYGLIVRNLKYNFDIINCRNYHTMYHIHFHKLALNLFNLLTYFYNYF